MGSADFGSCAAARMLASEPNWDSIVAAVFSPTPGTPGSPSDGSPRSSASSAYASPARFSGTPYFSATSAGPNITAFDKPRPI